jgi:hypothetical protein
MIYEWMYVWEMQLTTTSQQMQKRQVANWACLLYNLSHGV